MKFVLALLAGASLSALPVALAGAADPLPAPMPCVGPAAVDKAGDQIQLPPAANANLDIKSYFFRAGPGADGKPQITADLQIADLTKTLHADVLAVQWEVYYKVDGFARVAVALLDQSGAVKFYEGSSFIASSAPEFYGLPESTTGGFVEGKDGVISIVLPAELAGKTFKETYAVAHVTYLPVQHHAPTSADLDRAPDGDKFGKDFVAKECPPEPVAPTDTTPTETTPEQAPQPQPQPQQPPQQQPQPQQPMQTGPPAPGQPLPATGTLTADAAADKGKRKTARKRGLRVRVRCSVQCKVKASAKITKKVARKLKLGRKAVTIGKGKATITKAGRIKFYVKMTKKAKRALKRKGVKKFALKMAFTVTDMQGGQAKKITKKSTLR